MYRTLFYVNIYGSYKLSKNSPVFLAHPVYIYIGLLTVDEGDVFSGDWDSVLSNDRVHVEVFLLYLSYLQLRYSLPFHVALANIPYRYNVVVFHDYLIFAWNFLYKWEFMWYNKNTRTRVATWPSQHFFVLALWNGRVIVQARTTAAVLSYCLVSILYYRKLVNL